MHNDDSHSQAPLKGDEKNEFVTPICCGCTCCSVLFVSIVFGLPLLVNHLFYIAPLTAAGTLYDIKEVTTPRWNLMYRGDFDWKLNVVKIGNIDVNIEVHTEGHRGPKEEPSEMKAHIANPTPFNMYVKVPEGTLVYNNQPIGHFSTSEEVVPPGGGDVVFKTSFTLADDTRAAADLADKVTSLETVNFIVKLKPRATIFWFWSFRPDVAKELRCQVTPVMAARAVSLLRRGSLVQRSLVAAGRDQMVGDFGIHGGHQNVKLDCSYAGNAN